MAQPVMQPIIGVATSVAAFIGCARRGPVEEPLRIASFADFEREFGGLWRESRMSYAVQQYFQNGGGEALIVRLHNGARAARLTRPDGFALVAANEGLWGEALRLRIDHETRKPLLDEGPESLFNVSVKDTTTGAMEQFAEVSTEPGHQRFVGRVLEEESKLVRIAPPGTVPTIRPSADGAPPAGGDPLDDPSSSTPFDSNGDDGIDIGDEQVATGTGLEAAAGDCGPSRRPILAAFSVSLPTPTRSKSAGRPGMLPSATAERAARWSSWTRPRRGVVRPTSSRPPGSRPW